MLNRFRSPKYIELTIVDDGGAVVGTIRVKPSGVLWRPLNARGKAYYSVPLSDFEKWITHPATKARKVKQ